jgi:hypothetical protein
MSQSWPFEIDDVDFFFQKYQFIRYSKSVPHVTIKKVEMNDLDNYTFTRK